MGEVGRRQSFGQGVVISVLLSVLGGASIALLGAGATPAHAQGAVCPQKAGQLTLASESATTEAGVTTVVCDYQPRADAKIVPFVVEGRWASAAADPAAVPACGLPKRFELDSGFIASRTAAATASYEIEEQEEGIGRPESRVVVRAIRKVLAAIEAGAAPCPGPPVDTSRVDVATPPLDPAAEELAFYDFALACPGSVGGFVLTSNGSTRAGGGDWLGKKCEYTRSGVEPSQAQRTDQAGIDMSWNKANGRTGRFCLRWPSTTVPDTTVFRQLFDGAHSVQVEFDYPVGADAGAFEAAGAGVLAAVAPFAYVCPNAHEIVFDPIPPYWQPVFGSNPPPEPLILPEEVTPETVQLPDASTTEQLAGGASSTPGDSTSSDTATQVGATSPSNAQDVADAASGSIASWIVGILMVILTIAGLALSILLVRRQTRIRVKWDVVRIVISVVTLVAMAVVLGVDTPLALIGAGVVIGGVLGVLQGRALEIKRTDKGLYAKRNAAGVAVFGVGLVIVQVAGIAGRASAVALGLTVGILSAAMTAGLVVGRSRRIAAMAGTGMLGIVAALGLAATLMAVGSPGLAQTDEVDPVEEYLLDLVDWDDIRVIGGLWATTSKPLFTISVPRGLTEPPADIERTIAWETPAGSAEGSYEVTESYTFTPTDDGTCCVVIYVADGVAVSGDRTTSQHVEGTIVRLSPGDGSWPPTTFGDPIEFGGTGIDPVPCGRPIATVSESVWTSFLVNGKEASPSGGPDLNLVTDCEIEGFSVSDALARAPEPPPQGARERYQGSIGPCPVLQEIVGPIAEAAGVDDGSVFTLVGLYREPNAPVCDSGLELGVQRPGHTQIRSWWKLASSDVEYEVARQAEINKTFLSAKRQYNIYDEEACQLDANGDVLPPAEGEVCYRSQFFHVGSEVRVWTSYTGEGPAYEVRGRMGWGSYWVVCHHCPFGGPAARNVIAAMHSAAGGSGAAPPAAAPPPAASAESDGATGSEAVPGSDVGETTEQGSTEDGQSDIDPMAAAIAATIALIGAGVLTGTALTESGASLSDLPDLFRDDGDGAPGTGAGETPAFIDPYDQTPLEVDAVTGKVFWPWDGGDGHWVDADEAPALIQEWDRELEEETARRVADHDAQADRDWEELKRRAREDAVEHPAEADDATPAASPDTVPPTTEIPPDAVLPTTADTPPTDATATPTAAAVADDPLPEPPDAETPAPPVQPTTPTDEAPFDDDETWTSRADGSDFLGSDTMGSIADATGALLDAQEKLDETLDDLGVSDETREAITERLAPVTEGIEAIKDKAELVGGTVTRAKAIADDTDARLAELGVPERLRDAVTWMRWMTEGLSNFGQAQADDYMAPVTEKIAQVTGGEASDYSSAVLPIGEFGREASNALVQAAVNVKGGSNYGGQLSENRFLRGVWKFDPNNPDDPYSDF